jgi:hypothetical protein
VDLLLSVAEMAFCNVILQLVLFIYLTVSCCVRAKTKELHLFVTSMDVIKDDLRINSTHLS